MPRSTDSSWTLRSTFVVIALVAMAAGCADAPASSGASAGPSSSALPSPVPTMPTSPPSSTSPAPTELPAPVADAWAAAGSTVHAYAWSMTRLVALPDGDALLIGVVEEGGQPLDGVLATERWNRRTGWRAGAWVDPRVGNLRFTSTNVGTVDLLGNPGWTFAVVALRDGRLLVAGGDDGSTHSIANALLYDPATDAWSTIAPLDQPRSHASAVLLPDGRILVVGGFVFEPGWDMGRAPGVALARAAGQSATHGRGDGILPLDVAVPPFGPALATAELFDPASGTWSPTGPMRFARTGPAITVLDDGRVLVAGADGEPTKIDARAFTTAEVYDPGTGRFASAGTLPGFDRATIARLGVELPDETPEAGSPGTLVALADGGAVLVAREVSWKHEGEVVWSARVAPDLGQWRLFGAPFAVRQFWDSDSTGLQVTGTSRRDAVVVSLGDGSVLVVGGSGNAEYGLSPTASVGRYDPVSDSWSSATDLPALLEDPLGVRLADATILVVGGWRQFEDGSAWSHDTYRYRAGSLPGG
jgi:hypothetical protein